MHKAGFLQFVLFSVRGCDRFIGCVISYEAV